MINPFGAGTEAEVTLRYIFYNDRTRNIGIQM